MAAQAYAQDKAAGTAAPAATGTAAGTGAAPSAAGDGIASVTVVGARAAQQTAIDRKKHSATAMDSIIAEDVGDFPDRNVGEAISRIAGVALNRGDFGEGMSVNVRGNGADLTRVEIDGLGVQAGGGTDLLGGGEGRGVEFRELSSDLIKSVDVVKGYTADMTEGSLGGGILIKTRTGLDFKKPYYSLRLGATEQSLIKKVTPNANLVLSNKFLDGKLGLLFNATVADTRSESHSLANGGTNNQVGQIRPADFDNSPEKTFAFNPATVADTTAARTPALSSPLTAGGSLAFTSPLELVQKSAAAQTKADCYAAFPNLSTAQVNSINGSTARNAAINRRSAELMTCLNQWNDYTPSLNRSYVRAQDDSRRSADIRIDYKVHQNLALYAKGSASRREVTDVVGNLALGQISFNSDAVTTAGYTGPSYVDSATGLRSVAGGLGYTLLPGSLSARSNLVPAQGVVVNIKPGYTVDASHHLTSYTLADAGMTTDMIFSNVKTSTRYLQTGGTYKNGGLKVEYVLGDAKSDFLRMDRRSAVSYNYGEASFSIQPDGSWGYSAANPNAQLDFDKYVGLNSQAAAAAVAPTSTSSASSPAYTSAQRALVTRNVALAVIRAQKSETDERTGKIDFSYAFGDRVPYLTNVKFGLNGRESKRTFWNIGGSTTVKEPTGTFGTASFAPGVYLPSILQTNNIIGCQNTAGSLGAGGQPCAYGSVPSKTISSPFNATLTLNQADFRNFLAAALSVPPAGQFYSGAKDRGAGLIDGWYQLDIDRMYQMAGVTTHLDCIVECVASDGNVYQQPYTGNKERTVAGYISSDFEIDHLPYSNKALPFGWTLTGNIGARVVKTDVGGTGSVTFNSVRKNANFDPNNPTLDTGVTTYTVRRNTTLEASTTDVLPVLNLALWTIPDTLVLRYSGAKTVARPPVSKLIPNANCTFDERVLDQPAVGEGDDADQRCSSILGNPALKPYTNINHNLSAEWYPNRDTMFSVAGYIQHGLIGAPNRVVARQNQKVFAGTDARDPVTGASLSDVEFTFSQYENQDPSTRRGVEMSGKTAFAFLPWKLRYTGFDFNYTRQRSDAGVQVRDLNSGDLLPVPNEPKYSYNASLWYDDGALSARLALQVVAPIYSRYSPATNTGTGVNNYPSEGNTVVATPYNPGAPIFTDMTRYLDFKIAYKWKNGIDIFLEGRNIGLARKTTSTGGYNNFSGGIPALYEDKYAGSRIMIGLNIRSL